MPYSSPSGTAAKKNKECFPDSRRFLRYLGYCGVAVLPMNTELRNTLAWIVCATGVMGVAIWQAQVSIVQDIKSRIQTLPPPLKSRHAIRPVQVPWTGDPVADYFARCENGLTDQKIGWIIEDFKGAGLDAEITDQHSWEELFTSRTAQHRWYHDALVDGLRLSAEQSTEATEKLNELFDLAKANFVEASGKPKIKEINGIWKDTNDGLTDDFTRSSTWLKNRNDPFDQQVIDLAYQPWNLCNLTPGQQEITWKHLDPTSATHPEEIVKNSTRPLDAEMIQQYQVANILIPEPDTSNNSTLHAGAFLTSNFIFQFIPQQQFGSEVGLGEITGQALLSKVRLLHPAQFKTLLLFKPEWAGKIQQALDTASR